MCPGAGSDRPFCSVVYRLKPARIGQFVSNYVQLRGLVGIADTGLTSAIGLRRARRRRGVVDHVTGVREVGALSPSEALT